MHTHDANVALSSVQSFIEDLLNAIVVACQLLDQGHAIDLTGFDEQVGLLCAKTLDLPPTDGSAVRGELTGLLERVESLHRAMLLRAADA